MPTQHPLLDISEIDTDIEAYLKQIERSYVSVPGA